MLRQNAGGLPTYSFESLAAENLVHAVFTRLGGVSQAPFATLNVGHTVGDEEGAVLENHTRIRAHLDLEADCITSPRQVHGSHVAVITPGDAGRMIPNTDGLVTDLPGIALLLRFADCVPVLLYDPVHHALGLVHAGWRGVAQAIARRAVETMAEAFGTRPEQLLAGLGPAIGPCCYTVGDNVAAAMGYALPKWQQVLHPDGELWRLDLPAANAQQLHAAGVRQIEHAHLCTACHTGEFFSHRAEKGQTGRFAVAAFLVPAAGTRGQMVETAASTPGEEEWLQPLSLDPPGLPSFGELLGGNP